MVKVTKIENGFQVAYDKQPYAIESGGIVVIAPMRVKSCSVTFWTEDDWAKEVEKEQRRLERELKKLPKPCQSCSIENKIGCWKAEKGNCDKLNEKERCFVTEPTKTLLDEPFDLKAEERARKALDLIKNNPDAFNGCVETNQGDKQ